MARRRIIARRPNGPANKFNRKTRQAIYEALRARLPITRASVLAGITRQTYRDWMIKGKDPDAYPIHNTFRKKVKEIEADAEREALRIIRKVARGNYKVFETRIETSPKGHTISRKTTTKAPVWQAAAWFLERRYKDEYGRDAMDELQKKTPEELAAEIKAAADTLFGSIPLEDNGNEATESA